MRKMLALVMALIIIGVTGSSVMAQQLGVQTAVRARIHRMGAFGNGIAISTEDPMDFELIKVAIAGVKVGIWEESAEVLVGVLHFGEEKFRLKDIEIGNGTARAQIYDSDGEKVGSISLDSYPKGDREVWAGTLTLREANYNAYVIQVPRKVKPLEKATKAFEYCKNNPEKCKAAMKAVGSIICDPQTDGNCRDKIRTFCEQHPDDNRCRALKLAYCKLHLDDAECRAELMKRCKENLDDEVCERLGNVYSRIIEKRPEIANKIIQRTPTWFRKVLIRESSIKMTGKVIGKGVGTRSESWGILVKEDTTVSNGKLVSTNQYTGKTVSLPITDINKYEGKNIEVIVRSMCERDSPECYCGFTSMDYCVTKENLLEWKLVSVVLEGKVIGKGVGTRSESWGMLVERSSLEEPYVEEDYVGKEIRLEITNLKDYEGQTIRVRAAKIYGKNECEMPIFEYCITRENILGWEVKPIVLVGKVIGKGVGTRSESWGILVMSSTTGEFLNEEVDLQIGSLYEGKIIAATIEAGGVCLSNKEGCCRSLMKYCVPRDKLLRWGVVAKEEENLNSKVIHEHCYNEIMDWDEEGIDCGGKDCKECTEEEISGAEEE